MLPARNCRYCVGDTLDQPPIYMASAKSNRRSDPGIAVALACITLLMSRSANTQKPMSPMTGSQITALTPPWMRR